MAGRLTVGAVAQARRPTGWGELQQGSTPSLRVGVGGVRSELQPLRRLASVRPCPTAHSARECWAGQEVGTLY